ncbi:MAG: ABC transporter substrate-binding protein [Chloroflexi bacterium]|nr:ABC transporter substrate-binding protein [Chloroflexota bacterium]
MSQHTNDLRICSLLPSGTEILFALDLGNQVVGVSDLCDYPPAARDKRIVSRSKVDAAVLTSDQVEKEMRRLLEAGEDLFELDRDWLNSNPVDVVLTQDLCYFCEVDAGQVLAAVSGMQREPRVEVLQPRTLADILSSIKQVGDACGAVEAAARLVGELEDRIAAVIHTVALAASKPRVFSVEGVNPLVIGGHWIPDLLATAGGSMDIYLPGCPAKRIDWNEIVDYAPNKLFIDLCSSDLDRNLREIPWLAGQEGWETLPAVQAGEVYLIDHVYFSRPGPRVVQGLEILAQLTHPDLFDGLIPPDSVLKLVTGAAGLGGPEEMGRCFLPYQDQ